MFQPVHHVISGLSMFVFVALTLIKFGRDVLTQNAFSKCKNDFDFSAFGPLRRAHV